MYPFNFFYKIEFNSNIFECMKSIKFSLPKICIFTFPAAILKNMFILRIFNDHTLLHLMLKNDFRLKRKISSRYFVRKSNLHASYFDQLNYKHRRKSALQQKFAPPTFSTTPLEVN